MRENSAIRRRGVNQHLNETQIAYNIYTWEEAEKENETENAETRQKDEGRWLD